MAALAILIAFVIGIAAAAGGGGGSCEGAEGEASAGTIKGGVPKKLVPIYQAAAAKYGLGPKGPAMLASINFNETSFGTNLENTSGSGAEGWMMFMPETWASYGVDANGDGKKDPYDPEDAIFAAARYLRASGAPANWHEAIFAYNHADWYVERIMGDFRRFQGSGMETVALGGACLEASEPNARIARMVVEANRLSALRPNTEYVHGGSHGLTPTPRNGPFDCSSAVSHLLQVGGFKNETMTTVGFHTWGKAGPGRWITILNKPFGADAHVILRFEPGVTPPGKRYWGTSAFIEGGGHGPGWIPESTFSASYLAGFEERHPAGF
jgi:hypothetical protein